MKGHRFTTALALCGALAFGAAACGDEEEPAAGGGGGGGEPAAEQQLSGEIAAAGSSAQAAAMEAWIAGFQEANPEATVSYDPVGSGGGREQFVAGGVALAGSDAALEEEELQAAQERCGGPDNLIEIPGYVSPIAIAYNLEGVQGLQLSPETLAGIMAGDITQWNAPEIAQDNPDAELPDERIVVVHRSDESGTTENLQEYLAAVAPQQWDFEVSGDWPEGAASGESAQGTSGVVRAIEQGSGTIGYADLSQVREPLQSARIGVGQEFVEPSPEAAAAILEASEQTDDPGQYVFTYDLNRETEESGTYPIVLVSYQLACTQYDDQQQGPLVQGFLDFIVSEQGQQAAAQAAGSAPLSQAIRQQVTPAVEAIGSGGGGS